MKTLKPLLTIILLTIGIYILTTQPPLSYFKIQMAFVSFFSFCTYLMIAKKNGTSIVQKKSFMYFLTATVLFLVGATGWFFTPFFFFLYFLSLLLVFIFPPYVSLGLVTTLVVLFSFNIGDEGIYYDSLLVISLFLTLPLAFYLRKEYLKIKQENKEILILQKEKREYQNKIDEVLSNSVNNFAANLRQSINDAKTLAYSMQKTGSQVNDKKNERIIVSMDEAMRLVKEFEEETTGKKLLSMSK